MRKIEIKVFILVVAFFILLSNINNSYARYVSSSTDNTTADVKQWKVLVDNSNGTYSATHKFNSQIIQQAISSPSPTGVVREGKLAPGSTGYFDIIVDPTHIQTAYNLTISTSKTGNIDNLKVIGLTISSFPSGVSLNTPYHYFCSTVCESSNMMFCTRCSARLYDNNGSIAINSGYLGNSNYTIRVFFQWVNMRGYGDTNAVNAADTAVGKAAVEGKINASPSPGSSEVPITYGISVTLTFSQTSS